VLFYRINAGAIRKSLTKKILCNFFWHTDKSTLVEPKLYPKPAEYPVKSPIVVLFYGTFIKRVPLAYARQFCSFNSFSCSIQNRIHIAV
jgi:hypothetical protein